MPVGQAIPGQDREEHKMLGDRYPEFEHGKPLCVEDGEPVEIDKSNPLAYFYHCPRCRRKYEVPPDVDAKERGAVRLF